MVEVIVVGSNRSGKRIRTDRAQKNRFEIRNGSGAKTRTGRRKIGKTHGGQHLLGSLRSVVTERSALHQFVIGVKHDAKLRNVYAGQIPGLIKFLSRVFFGRFSTAIFGSNSLISAHFEIRCCPQKNFSIF
jgi:hypothetical protein